MAVLSTGDREAVRNLFASDLSSVREAFSLSSADLIAAVNAVDLWVSDNSTAYNNALPTAAKDNMTAAQKSRMLSYVLKKRYEEGT